jgi:hypothetical protein
MLRESYHDSLPEIHYRREERDGRTIFLTVEADDGRFTWNISLPGALLTGLVTYKRPGDAFRAARRTYAELLQK